MKKLFDILVVGELNVDLILNGIEKFPEIGKEVLARGMTLTLGSSSAIFASNIARLGARVAFLGKIGEDKFGEIVTSSLVASGVDISMVRSDPDAATGATIILNVDEDRANTTYAGAMEMLTDEDITDADLDQAMHLHFSSYFLQPGMWKGLGNLFRRARMKGLTTSFDMQWDPAEKWELDYKAVLPHVNVFLPNEKELQFLAHQTNLTAAIGEIKPYTDILVVKRGNKGSMVIGPEGVSDMPPFLNNHVVDAIGAGDSFNAGFILKYIRGASLQECQQFGNLAGAISTTAAGGTAAFTDYAQFKATASNRFGITV
jgi:sugar/nucleoside kinase (ribokinase family)